MPRGNPIGLMLAIGLVSTVTASAATLPTKPPPRSSATQVVVRPGQPIRIVVLMDPGSNISVSAANAVRMAVGNHGRIRGHAIQVGTVEAETCGQPVSAATAAITAAAKVVANLQNVAVLGPICSFGLGQALAVYQRARLVAVSGSATDPEAAPPGTTVFDRTIVPDDQPLETWFAAVSQLPSDLAWRQLYTSQFGAAPFDYADLYYDAAGIVVAGIENVARTDTHRDLVVDRAALARTVRATTDYPGVTCTVSLDQTTGDRIYDAAALSHCAGSTG